MTVRIINGDCREMLATLPDKSIHCCVTSPPYFGLRDYGVDGQMGLEPSPEQFIAGMVDVFREVRRVLRDDGTLWLNIGDSYAGSGRGGYPGGKSGLDGSTAGQDQSRKARSSQLATAKHEKQRLAGTIARAWSPPPEGYKQKDLIGIPWMLALALRAGWATCSGCSVERRGDLWPVHNGHRICIDCALDGRVDAKVMQTEAGWYLRQEIIWHKPNPMPESVTDRCTKSHEQLFLLTKCDRYAFDADAIAEGLAPSSIERLSQAGLADQAGSNRVPGKTNGPMKAVGRVRGLPPRHAQYADSSDQSGLDAVERGGRRNKRSVWTIATQPFKEAHFATFPPALVEPCILAGCPVGGTVLDPFGGAGTTGLVAQNLGRQAVLIELNPAYADIADRRIRGGNVGLPLSAPTQPWCPDAESHVPREACQEGAR